jgi:hypothetical protein
MRHPILGNVLKRFWIAAAFFCVACAAEPRIAVTPLSEYDLLFQKDGIWRGADGDYTVRLDEGKTLWLFGDTLLADIDAGKSLREGMINNSVAIQQGHDPMTARLTFYYGRGAGGESAAFFAPENGRGWFWPFHGLTTPSGLYVFLVRVEREGPESPFGFRASGNALVRISNPGDSVDQWRLSAYRIPWARFSPSKNILFGSAVLPENGDALIYGVDETIVQGKHRKYMILARAPGGALEAFDQWRFYGHGVWSSKIADAERLCEDVANEYSVSYLPERSTYVLIQSADGFSDTILARFASKPWGPWGGPRVLYRCPEARRDKRFFCYAAKGHTELSRDAGGLIVTYVAASTDARMSAENEDLYWPRFLHVRFVSGDE